jgi:hypothetical protein
MDTLSKFVEQHPIFEKPEAWVGWLIFSLKSSIKIVNRPVRLASTNEKSVTLD